MSFDLNGLKNSSTKNFENSLKPMQIFKIFIGGINFRERSQKNPNVLRSEECMATYVLNDANYYFFKVIFKLGYNCTKYISFVFFHENFLTHVTLVVVLDGRISNKMEERQI